MVFSRASTAMNAHARSAAAAVGILHTAFFIPCGNGREVLEERSGVTLVGVQQMRPEHIPTRRRYLNTPLPRGHFPFSVDQFGMFLATSLPCGMHSQLRSGWGLSAAGGGVMADSATTV